MALTGSRFSKREAREFASGLDWQFSTALFETLNIAVDSYHSEKDSLSSQTSRSEKKKALNNIKTTCENFLGSLDATPGTPYLTLQPFLVDAYIRAYDSPVYGEFLERLKRDLRTLIGVCDSAIENLPAQKGGRRPEWYMPMTLLHMATVFRIGSGGSEITLTAKSDTAARSPFLEFFRRFLEHVEPVKAELTDEALKSALDRHWPTATHRHEDGKSAPVPKKEQRKVGR